MRRSPLHEASAEELGHLCRRPRTLTRRDVPAGRGCHATRVRAYVTRSPVRDTSDRASAPLLLGESTRPPLHSRHSRQARNPRARRPAAACSASRRRRGPTVTSATSLRFVSDLLLRNVRNVIIRNGRGSARCGLRALTAIERATRGWTCNGTGTHVKRVRGGQGGCSEWGCAGSASGHRSDPDAELTLGHVGVRLRRRRVRRCESGRSGRGTLGSPLDPRAAASSRERPRTARAMVTSGTRAGCDPAVEGAEHGPPPGG